MNSVKNLSNMGWGIGIFPYPFWYYKRVTVTDPIHWVTFDSNNRYRYDLRYIVANWIGTTTEDQVLTDSPGINFELFKIESGKEFQDTPIPFGLVTSPGGAGNGNYSAAFINPNTIGAVKFRKRLKHIFNYDDTILIKITGQDYANRRPQYIHIMLMGNRVPVNQESGVLHA